MGHLLGYARVSTTDQHPHLQVDALTAAGCYRVFTETASGTHTNRPTLEQLLDQLRPGDTLIVWKLDRLGRSLRHLVDTVTGPARVNLSEADPWGNHCVVVVSSFGSLIQTAVGSAGGWGGLRTKRSGCWV
jgi:predicted site-specific integrase-resolvase